MTRRPRHLGELRWTDIAPGSPPILAVPVGSCEQHGPHLPLDTDTRIAVALAERLTEHRTDVVVTPALTVTASGEHAGFPGTLSIGVEATATVLIELIRSADWARGLVLVNGHGGNHEAVETAMTLASAENRSVAAFWPRVDGGDLHAGRTETSIMLHLDATVVVDVDIAQPGPTPTLEELRRVGVRPVSPTGVLGDPTDASPELGDQILRTLTDQLVRCVAAEWPT